MRICIINYSSRTNGNCTAITQFIVSVLNKEYPSCQISVVGFPDIEVHHCGECNYECFGVGCPNKNDAIQIMYDEVVSSDLLLSVIPIYGGLPCSNYFAFSERAQGALTDDGFNKIDSIKNKYIVVGNTGEEVTKAIIKATDLLFSEKDILFVKSHTVGERSIRGNLMEYECFRGSISSFVVGAIEEHTGN